MVPGRTVVKPILYGMRELIENPFRRITIDWQFTHLCNFKCFYCYFIQIAGKRVEGQLSTEEMFKVNDFIAALPHDEICINMTGGEITLRKDMLSIIEDLCQKS